MPSSCLSTVYYPWQGVAFTAVYPPLVSRCTADWSKVCCRLVMVLFMHHNTVYASQYCVCIMILFMHHGTVCVSLYMTVCCHGMSCCWPGCIRRMHCRFMASEPDKWDYALAGIPSPLTDEMESQQTAKQVDMFPKWHCISANGAYAM